MQYKIINGLTSHVIHKRNSLYKRIDNHVNYNHVKTQFTNQNITTFSQMKSHIDQGMELNHSISLWKGQLHVPERCLDIFLVQQYPKQHNKPFLNIRSVGSAVQRNKAKMWLGMLKTLSTSKLALWILAMSCYRVQRRSTALSLVAVHVDWLLMKSYLSFSAKHVHIDWNPDVTASMNKMFIYQTGL